MNETDIRVMLLNAGTFVITFAQIEMALKIALLLISIGYTAQRWYIMHKKNNGKNDL
jgi:hypothetical protein